VARLYNRGVKLPIIHLEHFFLMKGDIDELAQGDANDYVTSFALVVPLDQTEFIGGTYRVEYQGCVVNICIYEVTNASDDPIFQAGKTWQLGASPELQGIPFSVFTDNRGKYPCFYAELIFPYRLKDWITPTHDEKTKITGVQSEDKILALTILNRLFEDNSYPAKVRSLQYEDVTVFLETYFWKGNPTSIFQLLTALASRNAFEESIIEYLGRRGIESILKHVSEIAEKERAKEIRSETDLLETVMSIITDVIKHHVENRNWIEPFWDGSRKMCVDGKNVTVPARPKAEIRIQPTLYVLLHLTLFPLGIHVLRETHEGVGSLDFRCVYTTQDGTPISISVEFKLAHHGRLKKGLTRQLPAYLRANQSSSGIFLVMWFKDDGAKFFGEPKNRSKSDTAEWLGETAGVIGQEKGLTIKIVMIDASIRPSASNL
jgi:hypothetical protein